MTALRMMLRSLRQRLGSADQGDTSTIVPGRQVGVLRMVAALSLLIPLLLLALFAWQTWRAEMDELRSALTTTLTILSEEAQKVFENQEQALDWIDDRAKRLTWTEIETSRDFFRFAQNLADKSPYIDRVFLVDAAGIIRENSGQFPIGRAVSVADRDYFIAAKRAADGVQVGEPAQGRLSGKLAFRVVRRRSSADGSFDGIVAVSFAPDYFVKFFARIGGENGNVICLARSDGTVLVSSASGRARGTSPPNDHLCTVLMRTKEGFDSTFVSTLDGTTRVGGKRQLHGYPILLGYAVDLSAVRREWLEDLALVGVAAIVSSLMLFGVSYAALRIARGERQAIGAWQEEVKHRERIEAQIRQTSKMELMGRMFSGVAHHFNNLLPALSGLLELTVSEVTPESRTAKRLERMLAAVAQGQRLVHDILLFSRRPASSRERVAIAALIEETVALMQASLPAKVTVVTRLSFRGEIAGDRAGLQEIVMNLISNAVHAIGTNAGRIELMTERTSIDAAEATRLGVRPGEFVRVVCRDDGAGMTSAVMAHIFEPFFTTKEGTEGTGLGLAIVREIVEDLGGAIAVQSEPGAGTSFTLHLPMPADARRRSH